MKILIDTHIFLWAYGVTRKLSKQSLALLSDEQVEKYLSAASAWEIAIKFGKGSLVLPVHPTVFVTGGLSSGGIIPLPIRVQDALAVGDLPMHHNDPFDRLLIVQSRHRGIPILTDDKLIKQYDVETIGT